MENKKISDDLKNKLNRLIKIYPFKRVSGSKYFLPREDDWKIIKKWYFNIYLGLTNRCNSFCKFCVFGSSPFVDNSCDFSLDEILYILKRVGINKRIVLTGGEPTVRNDFFKIIDLINLSKNIPEVSTNGLKLADKNFTRLLKLNRVDRVYLSFDGFREDIYEILRGGKYEYRLKLQALKNLHDNCIKTFICPTIGKGINEDEVKNVLDFTIKSFSNKGIISGIKFYGLSSCGLKEERFLLKKNNLMSASELMKLLEEANKNISTDYFIETKRFMINIAKLLSKFNIPSPIGTAALYAFYKINYSNELREIIPLKRLERINQNLENNNLLQAFYHLLKSERMLRYAFNIFNPIKFLDFMYKENILTITVGNLTNIHTYKEISSDIIGIRKMKEYNSKLVFFNVITLPVVQYNYCQ